MPTRFGLIVDERDLRIGHFPSKSFLENTCLVSLLAELNSQAFDCFEPPSEKDTIERLRSTDSVMIAFDLNGPIGFATFKFSICTSYTLVYQSRGIIPRARRRGLGRQLTKLGIEAYQPEILAARTQNPASIWSCLRLEIFEIMYPIEKTYDEDKEIQATLKDLVEQRGGAGKVDLRTGLQKRAYRVGRLGKYEIDLSHPGIAKIEQKLIEFGLERDEGDTIYYMGKLKRGISTRAKKV